MGGTGRSAGQSVRGVVRLNSGRNDGAHASRRVSGCVPNSSWIVASTAVCSNCDVGVGGFTGSCTTVPASIHGEMRSAGTRGPRIVKSKSVALSPSGFGTPCVGGGWVSIRPPCSSYTRSIADSSHCGDARSAM
eukprot:Amastigsp_a2209_55.p5 type:complete len:134 gc:universal Amastigsp_a2209_55:1318-917(-)